MKRECVVLYVSAPGMPELIVREPAFSAATDSVRYVAASIARDFIVQLFIVQLFGYYWVVGIFFGGGGKMFVVEKQTTEYLPTKQLP